MTSTDAVNKAYVDSAVASVGAGAFVSKNGDAMAGPLTLSGAVASANGINVVLDAQFVADLKALIQAIEQYAKSAGIPKPALK